MIDPQTAVEVDDLGLNLLEFTLDELGEELLDVFALRVRIVRPIDPKAASGFLAVDMLAVVRVCLQNHALVVADEVRRRQARNSASKNRNSPHLLRCLLTERKSSFPSKSENGLPTKKAFR